MSDMLSLSYDQNLEPQVNTNETDWAADERRFDLNEWKNF